MAKLIVLSLWFSTPLFSNTNISAGMQHFCWIDNTGKAQCSGVNGERILRPYRNSTLIKAADFFTCAMDQKGETGCWGGSSEKLSMYAESKPLNELTFLNSAVLHSKDGNLELFVIDGANPKAITLKADKVFASVAGFFLCTTDSERKGSCINIFASNNNDTIKAWLDGLGPVDELVSSNNDICAQRDRDIECLNVTGKQRYKPKALKAPANLVANADRICALDDGLISCWNAFSSVPAGELSKGIKNPTSMTAGGYILCTSKGEDATCYDYGQNDRVKYIKVKADPNAKAQALSHFCYADQNKLRCLGSNSSGQLGNGDGEDNVIQWSNSSPVKFPGEFAVKKHLTRRGRTCALSDKGTLACVGLLDAIDLKKIPTENLRDFSMGEEFVCAIDSKNKTYCSGKNFGVIPQDILAAGSIESAGTSTCVVGSEGKVQCFGANKDDLPSEALPPVSRLSLGDHHGCAIDKDNESVLCWGQNVYGQLLRGHGKLEVQENRRPALAEFGSNMFAKDLACGANHCCAVTISNSMKCWGNNNFGQLGYGDTMVRGNTKETAGNFLKFVKMPRSEAVESIVASDDITCAKTKSGMRCWGYNVQGQLGTGDMKSRGDTAETVPELLQPLF